MVRVGSPHSAGAVLGWLWEMPDEGALMASIRARTAPAEPGGPQVKPDPESATGRLLARRAERGYGPDRNILAAIFHALSGQPWPGLPAAPAKGPGGAVVVNDLADLDNVL